MLQMVPEDYHIHCFVLFTPGLLTVLFNGPLKLEWQRQSGSFNLHVGYANAQGTSVILGPDPGLCGQP